jgi:hypothetical protein
MEESRRVGNRSLAAVHRFEREGEERLVMAYRSLEDNHLAKASPNRGTRPEWVGEHASEKRRHFCSIGEEVVS